MARVAGRWNKVDKDVDASSVSLCPTLCSIGKLVNSDFMLGIHTTGPYHAHSFGVWDKSVLNRW